MPCGRCSTVCRAWTTFAMTCDLCTSTAMRQLMHPSMTTCESHSATYERRCQPSRPMENNKVRNCNIALENASAPPRRPPLHSSVPSRVQAQSYTRHRRPAQQPRHCFASPSRSSGNGTDPLRPQLSSSHDAGDLDDTSQALSLVLELELACFHAQNPR